MVASALAVAESSRLITSLYAGVFGCEGGSPGAVQLVAIAEERARMARLPRGWWSWRGRAFGHGRWLWITGGWEWGELAGCDALPASAIADISAASPNN